MEKITQLGNGSKLIESDDFIRGQNDIYGTVATYDKRTNMTTSASGARSYEGNIVITFLLPIPHSC
jgi:hypothetical protein